MNTNIAADIQALTPSAPRQLTKTVAASGTPERVTSRGVTSITRVLNTVTVTTTAAHEYVAGDVVEISGANQAEYNGLFDIVSVPSSTTFTYAIAPGLTPVTPATGTLVLSAHLWFTTATFKGKNAPRTNNTGAAWLGWSSTNDTQPNDLASGGEVIITAVAGRKLNLRDLYLDVATNADGAVVSWS